MHTYQWGAVGSQSYHTEYRRQVATDAKTKTNASHMAKHIVNNFQGQSEVPARTPNGSLTGMPPDADVPVTWEWALQFPRYVLACILIKYIANTDSNTYTHCVVVRTSSSLQSQWLQLSVVVVQPQ